VVKNKWLELQPLITPNALTAQYRQACHLALILQARGHEVDSPLLRVEIHWDGQWADETETMQKHLVVKSVSGSE
jgi:hypothetical protein